MRRYLPISCMLIVLPVIFAILSSWLFERYSWNIVICSYIIISTLAAWIAYIPRGVHPRNSTFKLFAIVSLIAGAIITYLGSQLFGYIGGASYEYGDRALPLWTYALWLTVPLVAMTTLTVILSKKLLKAKNLEQI